MAIKYTISYLKHQSTGFSFSNFFRSRSREKCAKCRNHAVMLISKQDNADININLCIECYNFYSVENLLEYIEHGPRKV